MTDMLARQLRLSNVIGSVLLLAFAATGAMAGCSSNEGRTDSGLGSGNGTSSGGTNAGTGGINLNTGGTIDVGSGGAGPTNGKMYCQEHATEFVPQVPTVYVLVDQSGSIYDLQQWVPLRDAVLPVIQTLQADVRFGFGSYTGTQAACTGLNDLGKIDFNNYDAIAAKYNGLPTSPAGAQETPTVKGVSQAIDVLKADAALAPGPHAILLVTADDDNDFCDNGGADCGSDALIGALQQAAAQGIKTFIFGLSNSGIDNPVWFDYWAQAGNGEKPNWPDALTIDQYSGKIYNNCSSRPGWKDMWTASGHANLYPIGEYSTAGGTATAFMSADTAEVAQGIKQKSESLKNCIFDLGTDGVEVKEGAVGDIFVEDMQTPIPTDQWKMNSPTVLELVGDACTKWLAPETTKFFAGFECDQLIIK